VTDPASALASTPRNPLRDQINATWRIPEALALAPLLESARLPAGQAAAARALAGRLVAGLRESRRRAGGVDALMQEFALSSHEGIALMCLAEALLRIPDRATADSLIRDKLRHGHWEAHVGHSPSLFVNATAWGLLLTGRMVARSHRKGLAGALGRILARGGEPLLRGGMDLAMTLLGNQFVAGQVIEEALENSRPQARRGYRHSYDMLGEAAMTDLDARCYQEAYAAAIRAIGQDSAGRGPLAGDGISIKLSALHPRYGWAQGARVQAELGPRLTGLCHLARDYGIGVNIDAEESERLEPSLDLLEILLADPALAAWEGLGFVVQAYQKRAPAVIDWLVSQARARGRRLMVRLVKGAYWDSEIKRAQVEGQADYPVLTRKAHTDLAYLACARRLLAARDVVHPQFATHNALTVAAVLQMAGENRAGFEFQCLHGMGESLYDQLLADPALAVPCRIYAPVGSHDTLLAYLVRRLLENGANASFVHRVVDDAYGDEILLADPLATAEASGGAPHPAIPLPPALYGPDRPNARGWDLADGSVRAGLMRDLAAQRRQKIVAGPVVAGGEAGGPSRAILNPADTAEEVGRMVDGDPLLVERALAAASAGAASWAAVAVAERAAFLRRAADRLEADAPRLLPLLVREAGKTWPAAVAELREAVDFCCYYASRAELDWTGCGPPPLGPVLCISPWNFPLAIFTGQVAAALVAGNPVLAKPAEATPLVAARAVAHFHGAGVPAAALQLVPGPGATLGAALAADGRVRGVMFTGSTQVARSLHQTLAARGDIPLVAETGGINAMIVDSSALPEQVVADVLASAFDSAGQRCSALRVLCLQEEIAGPVLAMLKGALRELQVGPPEDFASDLGPVIDHGARQRLQAHVDSFHQRGREVLHFAPSPDLPAGSYFGPTLIQVERFGEVEEEVFGPVLHVLRFQRERLDALLADIAASGYGLTLGIHSRIDETVDHIVARARVGNVYVNRNMIGAVVGVQPFGGEGLSGTGPKAGGPFYLGRLVARGPLPNLEGALWPAPDPALEALALWLATGGARAVLPEAACQALLEDIRPSLARPLAGLVLALPGPTGESNRLTLLPRGRVRCLAPHAEAFLGQLAAVLASGNTAEVRAGGPADGLLASLPEAVAARIHRLAAGDGGDPAAILFAGPAEEAARGRQEWAARPGPLRPFLAPEGGHGVLPLLREQTLSVNTAAAGGNASLLSLE
jgi:RHH-type proline utilization regulon transcriptional repressor/proline dehydrogenase/delta 1-pyrroline-5-carboxylate dehydrogenase